MSLSEADRCAKLIDPKLLKRGWNEEHIKREETAGTTYVINGKGQSTPPSALLRKASAAEL